MQIISGKHRGRKIETFDSLKVRPTLGRTREALFNILQHGVKTRGGEHPFIGKRVADLYCGSGAFGLEALSRGASHVTFVDNANDVLNLARKNTERFGETQNARFLRSDGTSLSRAIEAYALLFIDPPYGENLATPTLNSVIAQGWVNEDSILIVEASEKDEVNIPAPLTQIDERHYGKTKILILRGGR